MEDEDECGHCFGTGEYFTGTHMEVCGCEAGDIIKESKDGNISDNETETAT
jgi:hypothetical protein